MPTVFENGFRGTVVGREAGGGGGATGYIVVSQSAKGVASALTGFPIIITDWQVNFTEKVQVLESFNEHVHAYAFGKGVGTASIGGRSLEDSAANPAHKAVSEVLVTEYNSKLRALSAAKAGRLVRISGPGGLVLSGVANGLTMSLAANASNVLVFQMNFLVLDSALGIGG